MIFYVFFIRCVDGFFYICYMYTISVYACLTISKLITILCAHTFRTKHYFKFLASNILGEYCVRPLLSCVNKFYVRTQIRRVIFYGNANCS